MSVEAVSMAACRHGNRILTHDVQRQIDSCRGSSQAEPHDDEDGRERRDAQQHPKHHRQGQRGQQGLGPAQTAGTHGLYGQTRNMETLVNSEHLPKSVKTS